jgi:hypothetical protein
MHHHTTHTSPTELHAQITADAAKATAQARKGGPMPHSEFPSLAALIEGAADTIQAALPTRYVHHGRSYRLQVVVQLARVAIFDGMAADRSMLVTVVSLPNAQGSGDANANH